MNTNILSLENVVSSSHFSPKFVKTVELFDALPPLYRFQRNNISSGQSDLYSDYVLKLQIIDSNVNKLGKNCCKTLFSTFNVIFKPFLPLMVSMHTTHIVILFWECFNNLNNI